MQQDWPDRENQQPIRKPTEFWASYFCLIERLSKMGCKCKVPHSTLEGTYRGVAKTHAARVWPWRLAAAVASGVSALIRRQYRLSCRTQGPGRRRHELYPSRDTPHEPKDYPPFEEKSRSTPSHWECPACAQSLPSTSPMHTRHEQQCRYPHIGQIWWPCPSCSANKSKTAV